MVQGTTIDLLSMDPMVQLLTSFQLQLYTCLQCMSLLQWSKLHTYHLQLALPQFPTHPMEWDSTVVPLSGRLLLILSMVLLLSTDHHTPHSIHSLPTSQLQFTIPTGLLTVLLCSIQHLEVLPSTHQLLSTPLIHPSIDHLEAMDLVMVLGLAMDMEAIKILYLKFLLLKKVLFSASLFIESKRFAVTENVFHYCSLFLVKNIPFKYLENFIIFARIYRQSPIFLLVSKTPF